MAKSNKAKSNRTRTGSSSTGGDVLKKKNEWTVMVYMAASKDAQTEGAAIRDLREMEKVGSTPDVDVVVQLDRDWPGFPERYNVGEGRSSPIGIDPRVIEGWYQKSKAWSTDGRGPLASSGDPDVLADFVTWTYEHYDSKHYLLVLWGHAFGLGFGRDHGDPLTVKELAERLTKIRKGPGRNRDFLLGTNACAMAYAEAVYELRDAADYLIASEITMPFAGWPYSQILQGLADTKSSVEAGRLILNEFTESFGGANGVALTLINLREAGGLLDLVRSLAAALADKTGSPAIGQRVAEAFLDSAHGDVRPLVDFIDLCSKLAMVGDGTIATAAEGVLKAFGRDKTGEVKSAKKNTLILDHQDDPDFVGLNGLGIFAPAVTSGTDLKRLELRQKEYEKLDLVRPDKNTWARFVYHDLASLLEPTNAAAAELVARTGASSREERDGVWQLLVSVNRTFAKVEDALKNVEGKVKSAFGDEPASEIDNARRAQNGKGAKPALSFLRLFDENVSSVNGAGHRTTSPQPHALQTVRIVPEGPLRENLEQSLRFLEDAVTTSERTLRRVLTNGRLGLGEVDDPTKPALGADSFKIGLGAPSDPPPKPGLGADDPVKPGFGDVDDPVKPGMGDVDDPVKPGMGILAGSPLLVARSETAGVVELFRLVANSLRGLEMAVAGLERITLGVAPEGTSSATEFNGRANELSRRALRAVRDQLVSARETTFWVLRHPTYGLGPGGLNAVTRQHLASAGGLNTQFLRLL